MLQRVLLYVASAGHVRAAEARPHRLRGVAVHAVPFLWIQDRVVLREPQSTHVLTLVHPSRSHALHMTVAKAAKRTTASCQGMLHLRRNTGQNTGQTSTPIRRSDMMLMTNIMLRGRGLFSAVYKHCGVYVFLSLWL